MELEVLTAIPAIARRIPWEVDGMMPQHFSNSLWPTNKLQDGALESLEVLTTDSLSAKRMTDKLKTFIPPVCVLKEPRSSVLAAVPALVAEVASSSAE